MKSSILVLAVLFLFYSSVEAQPVAKVSIVHPVTSIIVKIRSTASLSDSGLRGVFHSVSSPSNTYISLFRRTTPGMAVQSINGKSADSIGLQRIYRVPLREGLSAQDAVRTLLRNSIVEYAEPNYLYHIDAVAATNDSLSSHQWYLQNIHAPEAWQITSGDSTIHIGFVDTGVDWLHPDLVNQFAINSAEDINHNGLFDAWPSTEKRKDARGNLVYGDLDGIDNDGNGFADDVIGYDFVDQEVVNIGDYANRDPIPNDENGHGTLVAGVLAAQQNNGIGISGVAPKCKLVALRAFDATGNGEDDDIASAIVYAADNNIQVLNLSFGDIIPSLLQRDAIRYAVSKGTIVFASSGNGGGDSPHYPSDFDEVVSAGGTTDYPVPDDLFSLTTHSENMDIVAPAEDITTTSVGGGYKTVAGTSFSSPISAATAALLLAAHRDYTPLQLRSVIESSTQDIAEVGFDHQSANGRVDAFRAVNYKGGAAIKITSLHTLDEVPLNDSITIRGYAASTLFTDYSLSYAPGANPDRDPGVTPKWTEIAHSTSQILDGALGVWNTSRLDSGIYTLRLAVHSSDRRSTEERINVRLVSRSPSFVSFKIDTIFVNDRRGLLVLAQSSVPAQLEVRISGTGHTVIKKDDRLALEHAVVIKSEDITPGVSLRINTILRSPLGDSSSIVTLGAIPNEGISEQGFNEKPYTLPPGYALDTVLSQPNGDQVIESVFPDGLHFGPLKVFSFNGKKFGQIDSLGDVWIPRALGSTRGDGTPELLVQASSQTMLLRKNARGILGDTAFRNADYAFWGSTLADLDHDGKQEIIGYIDSSNRFLDSVYQAYSWNGSGYTVLGRMANPTSNSWNNPFNSYTEPNAAHADLRGNGTENLVTLDNDADLIVYERDPSGPNGFKAVYTQEEDGEAEGSLVTTGDFDGDGLPDIAFAYHSVFSEDTLREYPPAYWTVKVLRNLGGMRFENVYTDHFYYARPLDPYRSSVRSIRNVTGRVGDDLVCSFFPNFYLLEFDSASHAMRPIWHYAGTSVSPRGAIAYDFDRNGKREFGFVAGDSIRFFERDDNYVSRTPTPGGLNVSPLNTHRVDLDWGAVPGATKYYILRADQGANAYDSINASTLTHFTDSTVQDGDEFDYSVVAYDNAYAIPISLPAFSRHAHVHAAPRLNIASPIGQSVRIKTSERLRTQALSGGAIIVDDSITPSSISIGGDSALVLGFANQLSPGFHSAKVSSMELRDIYNSPFDSSSVRWQQLADSALDRFYIVSWNFETSGGQTRVHVRFNQVPGNDALSVDRYTLSPYGTLVRVERDPNDSLSLYIDLGSDTKFAALGVPFVLCVSGITSARNTPLDSREANCVGVSFTEPDLTNAMVYPNPAKQSDGQITFGRLTAQAEVRIYSLGMKSIRVLQTTERQGGVTWDMRDDRGQLVPSGIYLYTVTGHNDQGAAVAGQTAKFVIVGDKTQ